MAEVLIIDLDGVVRQWDRSVATAAECRHDLPLGSIENEAFAGAAFLDAITGTISDIEWRRRITESLISRFGPSAGQAVSEWSSAIGAVNVEVLEVTRLQRTRMRVALFSNATSRLPDDLKSLALDTEFDAVFNSSELHLAKPSSESFLAVADTLDCRPEDCLFVDDTLRHVVAASDLGMTSHHFVSVPGLVGFLDSCR